MVRFVKRYKYYIVKILLLTLIIVLRSISHSYAATASEWQADCREKLQTLTNKGLLSIENVSNVNLNQFTAYGNNSCYGYFIVVGHGNNNSYRPQLDTTNELYIGSLHSNGNITNHTNDTNNSLYNVWKVVNGGNPNSSKYTLSGGKLQDGNYGYNNLVDGFYCYTTTAINTRVLTLGAGEEYGGSYIISRFNINLLTSNIISDYKGQSNVYSYYYTYNNNNWLLGEVEGLDEVDEVEIKLNHYDSDRRIATWYKSNLVDDKFSVNGSLIYRNDLYFIDYDVWQGGEITDTGRYWVTFMPPGTIIQNGTIISVGSGDDYNVQNSTNDITNTLTDDSEVDSITNSYLSGDYESIAYDFGFTPLDNPFSSFILTLVDKMYDALTLRQNVILDESYETFHLHLESDDFSTPNTNFKNFCRLMLIFMYLYGNYKFFNHLITLLETAQIEKFTQELGTDEFYDTDFM